MTKGLILIPARFQSSRFPGKPLALLKGKPMIEWVYENAAKSGLDTYVVTDHQGIEDTLKKSGGKVLRVNDEVETGSERIALAYQRFLKEKGYTHIINVQGDEPLLKGEEIRKLFEAHANSSYHVMTIVKERDLNHSDWNNSNVVKVIYQTQSLQALYFSRASIPFDRDQKKNFSWYQHIGIYSYQPMALEKMVMAPQGQYEKIEKLEQLRILELGMKIGALTTQSELKGVDRPEDIASVEGVLHG